MTFWQPGFSPPKLHLSSQHCDAITNRIRISFGKIEAKVRWNFHLLHAADDDDHHHYYHAREQLPAMEPNFRIWEMETLHCACMQGRWKTVTKYFSPAKKSPWPKTFLVCMFMVVMWLTTRKRGLQAKDHRFRCIFWVVLYLAGGQYFNKRRRFVSRQSVLGFIGLLWKTRP